MFLLIRVVGAIFEIVNFMIIVRVVLSWIQPQPNDMRWRKVIKFIYDVTEPILGPIRRLLPRGGILGIDISPIIAIFALQIIQGFVRSILLTFAF